MSVVIKRNGTEETVAFDKIQWRVSQLANDLSIDVVGLCKKVIFNMSDKMKTSEIDRLTAECAEHMQLIHPDYYRFAARILVSNMHKETLGIFSKVMEMTKETGRLDERMVGFMEHYGNTLDEVIDYDRDYLVDLIGIKTLECSYLLKKNDIIYERPQDLFMRVALFIHGIDKERVIETYNALSQKKMMHATPTLFHAGLKNGNAASCFLLRIHDDSIEGIYKTLADAAKIAQQAGGIGVNISDIRATGSDIAGTGGKSNGIVPMLRVFDASSLYVDQGGGKRRGSIAVYIEPWHMDILSFLHMSRMTTTEERRASHLFTALWIPDLFMKRLEMDEEWTLFCPHSAPGLAGCWGDEFNALYEKYERTECIRKKSIKARDLWDQVSSVVLERGFPFVLFKDSCNRKNNQRHLGTIRGSNLCSEIIQFTSQDEIAVCNLASINLHVFCTPKGFDFMEFQKTVRMAVRNLDRIIDVTSCVLPETTNSNKKHRPLGLGVQGLADVFAYYMFPFESQGAVALNRLIFEHMYLAACQESIQLAKEVGAWQYFDGSPAGQGQLQFDLWNAKVSLVDEWQKVREDMAAFGMRNSLLTAIMPTVSTSLIFGQTESIEPFYSMVMNRATNVGTHLKVNAHLSSWLLKNGLWSESMVQRIMEKRGSVQDIQEIPVQVRNVFKTCWEIKQRHVIDMAAQRGPFIDQSQSLNLHLKDPTRGMLLQMALYAWKSGLKTGQYYLHTTPATYATQFTVKKQRLSDWKEEEVAGVENVCFSCSS